MAGKQNQLDRWVRTASDEAAVNEGCWFDLEAAERVREFFEKFLCHGKGRWAGKPFTLFDWEWEDVIAPVFGWKRMDGTRRFRNAYIEIPKKNGKSELFSGIAIYLLVGDNEAGAEVYSAAADRDQAGIVFHSSENMVKASPGLSGRLMITTSQKNIAFPQTASKYKALSADVPTKEGLNASAILFDELHAQKTRVLWDTLYYAGIAREQPLLMAITTAGWDRHSICWEQHELARKILDRDSGYIDTSMLAVIYGADEDDDWTDPAVWRKANPSYDLIIKEEEIAHACKEAQETPTKENTFKRYRLNIWTEQAVRWLPMEKWRACDGEVVAEQLKGRPCWAGLDLSTISDLTPFVLVFRPEFEGDTFKMLMWCWVPGESMEKRWRKDRVPYPVWQKQGFIEKTSGNSVDYASIRAKINEISKDYSIQEIAFDPWNATQLCGELADDGFQMVEMRQGFGSMNEPSKYLERTILDGKLAHGNNPVMNWAIGNVTIKEDPAGNIKPDKQTSSEKIDPAVALIMAIGRAGAGLEFGGSSYDDYDVEEESDSVVWV